LWWGRLGFCPFLLRFRFKSPSASHHVVDSCTKSRFPVYSVYMLIFTCQYYWLMCRSLSLYSYPITLIEWEVGNPSRTTLLEGQFRRSRDRVFIVQNEDYGTKNGLRQNFSKKLLPEVGKVASGRRFLAVLFEVVFDDRPEASGVGGLGQIPGQRGGVLEA